MRILKLVIVITFGAVFSSNGQDGVGIGTTNVDASAVLQVESTTKGVLIPRIASLGSIASPAEGLLVFNTGTQSFFYYSGGWKELNTLVRPDGGGTAATGYAINVGAITSSSIATGPLSASSYALNASGPGPVPQGGIIMWSGSTPPTGWALCNGGNGTPDLSGRFIVGYHPGVADYDQIGEQGGAAAVQLTDAQSALPSHFHSINHVHTINDPGHSHGILTGRNGGNGQITKMDANNPDTKTTNSSTTGITVNFFGGNSGLVSKAVADQAHENRPPYYVLAFIMKL